MRDTIRFALQIETSILNDKTLYLKAVGSSSLLFSQHDVAVYLAHRIYFVHRVTLSCLYQNHFFVRGIKLLA